MKGAFSRESQIVVEPDATLRVDGGSLAVASVENKGAIELVNGATLESAGGYVRGDVSGAGGFDAKGGEVTLIGEPTYSGATHVFSGTLNVGAPANPLPRPFDGKYFRLAIKRSNGGDSGGADIKHAATNFKLQASEFRLYSADGEVQSHRWQHRHEALLSRRGERLTRQLAHRDDATSRRREADSRLQLLNRQRLRAPQSDRLDARGKPRRHGMGAP